MRVLARSSDEFADRVERFRQSHPSFDERLKRYREQRREYEAKRDRPTRSRPYPAQRGVRRDYRV